MPLVRGRIIPEVELSGRAKQFLDILLWSEQLNAAETVPLDELDQLRTYLMAMDPFVCYIRIWVPERHANAAAILRELGIEHQVIPEHQPPKDVAGQVEVANTELLMAIGTALSVDADCLAVTRREWLPYIDPINTKLGILLTDCSFLLPYAEIFVRGHDVPWAFGYKSWYAPWNAFYQLAEQRIFKPGIELLSRAHDKNAPSDAQETGRILVHNRLPNLCFTRDRLLYYEIERLAAKRAGWKRQRYSFEIAYYLNFFYLLIYGVFDHAALFVSQLLGLGLPERQVGATYKSFLDPLEKQCHALHAIFTSDANRKFMDRIGYLRHFAAHRGSLMPTMVVEALEHDPTTAELDEDIRNAGLDYIVDGLAAGTMRDSLREMLRTNARMARYEKGKVLEDVVLIEHEGKFGFINPHIDTPWNFARVMQFLDAVFAECIKVLP